MNILLRFNWENRTAIELLWLLIFEGIFFCVAEELLQLLKILHTQLHNFE